MLDTPHVYGPLDQKAFNYRVAAVAIHNDKVLLLREEGHVFLFLPGGRVEYLESSSNALARELQEEAGAEVQVERLLWIHEQRFNFNDQAVHELCLYYKVTLPETLTQQTMFEREVDGRTFHFMWQPLEALDSLPIVPEFLKTRLSRVPQHPEHIVGPGLD